MLAARGQTVAEYRGVAAGLEPHLPFGDQGAVAQQPEPRRRLAQTFDRAADLEAPGATDPPGQGGVFFPGALPRSAPPPPRAQPECRSGRGPAARRIRPPAPARAAAIPT